MQHHLSSKQVSCENKKFILHVMYCRCIIDLFCVQSLIYSVFYQLTIFPLISTTGAYLILKLQGATLMGRQRLEEEGVYFKAEEFLA